MLEADLTEKRATPVSAAMEDALPVLAGDIPVGAAITLLQHCQAVLVQEHGAISGIVTNVDVGRVFSLQGR